MGNIIITIDRQFGSGGRELGSKLSKELNIPFYDEELVELAANTSDMNKEILKDVDEKATNSFLYSLASGNYTSGMNAPFYYEMPINDKLFIAQSDIIKKLAGDGSCIIVGRCADYVLADSVHKCVNIFVYAYIKSRIERISRLYNLSADKAKDKISKAEKVTKTYYNYYSNQEWGKIDNYDLCVNTSDIGIDNAVELVKKYIAMLNLK